MKADNKITVNGTEYIKADAVSVAPTKKQILVLDRGWIVVGDVSKSGDYFNVNNASVIRSWGTTKGIGELAEKGPLTNTKLDSCPMVQAHKLSVVLVMNCNEEAWK